MAKEPNLAPSRRNQQSKSASKVPVTKGQSEKPLNAVKPPPPPPPPPKKK